MATPPPPSDGAALRLRSRLSALTAAAGLTAPGAVSIAAVNTSSGRRVRFGATAGLVTASVVKLEILAGTLLRHQNPHRPLGVYDRQLAVRMIRHSDNDAAIALFDRLGGDPGLLATTTRLRLSHTVPGDGGYFGVTTSSAEDQIRLLKDITGRYSPIRSASRRLAVGLMRGVDPAQAWGVTVAADPRTRPAVKNGWLPVDEDAGRWAVGSVGSMTVSGQHVLLAVLTQHDADLAAGIAYIQQASRLLARYLTSTPG